VKSLKAFGGGEEQPFPFLPGSPLQSPQDLRRLKDGEWMGPSHTSPGRPRTLATTEAGVARPSCFLPLLSSQLGGDCDSPPPPPVPSPQSFFFLLTDHCLPLPAVGDHNSATGNSLTFKCFPVHIAAALPGR
jgi:hypothetical protein